MLQYNDSQDVGWFAVHVRSRHEKMVAGQLASRSVDHWLPLLERRKRWSDRFKTVHEPLFPGYLFVNIHWDDRVEVLSARGVVRLVSSGGLPCPVPDHEIEAIRMSLEEQLQVDPYPHLAEGMDVEVCRGVLKGHRGVLVEKHRRHRLILSVSLIGQSVAVEIDSADVRPV